ncbi:MAG TPA: IS200/IS605 family accessory protein TnpB-related protein, partial [Candidatus Bathyarchaeia archaeon]|nr:IS200/IS605 family accessory protein TnpB-related protein [Candidatus Bathyarchaeia archaeon]
MELFRQMVNRSITIGLETKKTSLKSLSLAAYQRLKIYRTRSEYRLCAISRAAGILKNYLNLSKKLRVREPYCGRASVTICYGIKIKDNQLYLPGGFHLYLNDYVLRTLGQPGIRVRSATLTVSKIGVSYSREVQMVKLEGMMSIDNNLGNVTAADSLGNILVHDLSKVTMVKSAARQAMAGFTRDDRRIRPRIFGKYGCIERNKTQWLMHNVSKKLVDHAKTNRLGIVLERINGIRRLYRKGNGQGRWYRARMNSWSYHELDRQISYKAAWEGLKVFHVNPKGTSSKCSACGDRMVFSK